MIYKQIINQYPIISEQITTNKLSIILSNLENILQQNIDGDIVEFGCYIGTTSLFIQRIIKNSTIINKKRFYVYDSFDGLPEKTNQDISPIGKDFKRGVLKINKKKLLLEFKKANLTPPIIYKSWFSQIPEVALPSSIAFAFLDGDFYTSILDSLKIVWPRLSFKGQVIIDDYNRDALPGVSKAITSYFNPKFNFKLKSTNNLAIITKINNS